ncbi:hypothetical protein KDK95_17795 [Actinospica sp. MGRD01-02]|uniref:Uncharacterized protein n=1 Tax=Actinospica acidithermotolerans TaxID=2828514 RepID=A0A941ED29_9ACTN|nr:hypothetical protein [Actinospica acidithermotolerans]MBR7828175.1 hypothetical protein [Actinospica acidithermotolerans]
MTDDEARLPPLTEHHSAEDAAAQPAWVEYGTASYNLCSRSTHLSA